MATITIQTSSLKDHELSEFLDYCYDNWTDTFSIVTYKDQDKVERYKIEPINEELALKDNETVEREQLELKHRLEQLTKTPKRPVIEEHDDDLDDILRSIS